MAKYPQRFQGQFSIPGPHTYVHKRSSKSMTLGIASPVRTNAEKRSQELRTAHMPNKLPVRSSVHGEEGRWAKDAGHSDRKILTMRDLVAPQTVDLFTITYELVAKSKIAVNR